MRWDFPKYQIMSIDETVDDIIRNKKSISRLGDADFLLLLEIRDVGYQNLDLKLAEKLREVLRNRNPKFLIGLPDSLTSTKNHMRFAKVHWLLFINTYGKMLAKVFDKTYTYGNSNMTRIYAGMKDKSKAKQYFAKIKIIWDNMDILIVEGDLSRLGVGNDLFDNAASVARIICPHKNAFRKYDDIKLNVERYGKNKLILFALGPTATVLCSELCNDGFWAVDVGHIDVEYMWMQMGTNGRAPIKGRFVNESDNSLGYDLEPELLAPYQKSIILDLSN